MLEFRKCSFTTYCKCMCTHTHNVSKPKQAMLLHLWSVEVLNKRWDGALRDTLTTESLKTTLRALHP